MENEQQLLKAIRNGEREALRRLYDRYAGYATAIALRYVGRRDDVADVLQDAFVKILTTVGAFEFRGEGSLKAWVARIVANEAIDYVKENSRFSFTDDLPDTTGEENKLDAEPSIDTLPPEVLTSLIGRLPPNYRLVLNLFVFEQCPHREIARQLGIKESTSSSIFFRAKKMLAKMINEYFDKQRV